MSFNNKSLSMPRDAGCLTDGEMGDASSRMDHKRAYQWFMGSSDAGLLCNKKQMLESPNNRPASGTADVNVSLWDSTHGLRASSLSNKSVSSDSTGNFNLRREGFENQFDAHSSVSLSMSQSVDNPLCLNSGIRKSKINQVANSEHFFSAPMAQSYNTEENDTSAMRTGYLRTCTSISRGPSYIDENRHALSMGPNSSKVGENLISAGQNFSKGDGTFMLMGHQYNRGESGMLTMGQNFDKNNCNLLSNDQLYGKDNVNFMSIVSAYNQGHENFIGLGPSHDKVNENFASVAAIYGRNDANINCSHLNHAKENASVISVDTTHNNGNSCALPMNHNYNNGQFIPFGFFHDDQMGSDHTGSLISRYDMLMSQSSTQASIGSAHKVSGEQNANQIPTGVPTTTTKLDGVPKNKEKKISKKEDSNNFPSNVKSLLSTGIFNGVPVMYVSWSREKKLPGVIKDSAYLCGCDDCKLSKAVNAYEFERHAGCKTKHPNNHIYFENGKTVYGVVQELKSTPQEKLFETIQNVTGSPVNEKNFHTWKASYQAATRELQRIYGKDEAAVSS